MAPQAETKQFVRLHIGSGSDDGMPSQLQQSLMSLQSESLPHSACPIPPAPLLVTLEPPVDEPPVDDDAPPAPPAPVDCAVLVCELDVVAELVAVPLALE